ERREDALDVLLDRVLGYEEPCGDRLVRASFSHEREHLPLACRQVFQRIVAGARAADELLDDERVEHRASLRDALDARRELAQVGDPLLEEVADSLAPLREELERVAGP